MREDPQPYKDPSQKAFAGDNFVRQSGDFHDMEALAVHSFSAHDKGQDIHMQGAPSQVCSACPSPSTLFRRLECAMTTPHSVVRADKQSGAQKWS